MTKFKSVQEVKAGTTRVYFTKSGIFSSFSINWSMLWLQFNGVLTSLESEPKIFCLNSFKFYISFLLYYSETWILMKFSAFYLSRKIFLIWSFNFFLFFSIIIINSSLTPPPPNYFLHLFPSLFPPPSSVSIKIEAFFIKYLFWFPNILPTYFS
jgi:hypothetical protein